MSSGCEAIMVAALTALQATTPVAANVKRAHRTLIPRGDGDTVHLIDGDDTRATGGGAKCGKRRMSFTTSIFVRSDAAGGADPYKVLICQRFEAATWPAGVMVEPPGRITIDTEIADLDATRVDIEWYATYTTAGEWSLE